MKNGDLALILIYEKKNQLIRIGCQNDTSYLCVIHGEITFNGPDPIEISASVGSDSRTMLHEIPFDQINDYPHFELEVERHSTLGHEETIPVKIKPKPKHFLKTEIFEEWGNLPGRKYLLWSEASLNRAEAISIKSKKKKTDYSVQKNYKYRVIRDLSELASISREIDLHAKVLFDAPGSVRPEDIYLRQMQTFRDYLSKVKSAGIDRVFIIHGVGSGRLKNSIARILEYDADVLSYTNEYHPKYGFGATEVVLK